MPSPRTTTRWGSRTTVTRSCTGGVTLTRCGARTTRSTVSGSRTFTCRLVRTTVTPSVTGHTSLNDDVPLQRVPHNRRRRRVLQPQVVHVPVAQDGGLRGVDDDVDRARRPAEGDAVPVG